MDSNPDLRQESIAARILTEAMTEHGWDGNDITLTVESETSFVEAVAATVRRIDELEELAGAAKALAARYTARAGDLMSRRESMREALGEALERSGVPLPLRLAEGTVTLTTPAPSAVVVDVDLVPDEYMRTKITKAPDMRSITLDLRDGKQVGGAILRNSRRSVQVRRG